MLDEIVRRGNSPWSEVSTLGTQAGKTKFKNYQSLQAKQ